MGIAQDSRGTCRKILLEGVDRAESIGSWRRVWILGCFWGFQLYTIFENKN